MVELTLTLPVDVQVAPVMVPPPLDELLELLELLDVPPVGVADAAFELLTTPFSVFLIQK
jgi:hypothetical protein